MRRADLLFFLLLTACGDRAAHVPLRVEAARFTADTAFGAFVPGPSTAAPIAVAPPKPPCPDEMALVPGGKLSTLERGHDVDVASFCIDAREVTVAAFERAVSSGGIRDCNGSACPALPKRTNWNDVDEDAISSRFCNGNYADRGDHPVNCVTHGEAEAYCRHLGGRLPTGDEWEWAARGHHVSPWGSRVATNQICWGKPKRRGGTCSGATLTEDITPEGVADMGGNLTEWVEPPKRAGHASAVWAYGASWYAMDDGYAMAALGGVEMPAKRAETVGFRCAADRAIP